MCVNVCCFLRRPLRTELHDLTRRWLYFSCFYFSSWFWLTRGTNYINVTRNKIIQFRGLFGKTEMTWENTQMYAEKVLVVPILRFIWKASRFKNKFLYFNVNFILEPNWTYAGYSLPKHSGSYPQKFIWFHIRSEKPSINVVTASLVEKIFLYK